MIIEPAWPPTHDEAAEGVFATLMRAVAEDVAGYGDDQLALILDFMDRHARTLQQVTAQVRTAARGAT